MILALTFSYTKRTNTITHIILCRPTVSLKYTGMITITKAFCQGWQNLMDRKCRLSSLVPCPLEILDHASTQIILMF
jgi:hypothetical protein